MAGKSLILTRIGFSFCGVMFAHFAVASNTACTPKTGNDLFKCVRERHVSLKVSALDLKKAEGNLKQAGNFTNPEFGSSGIVGDNFGQTTTEIQADLQFILEMGGKRSARKGSAESAKKIAEIDLNLTNDQVTIEAGQLILRLRQLEKEIAAFKEALETFSRIERQYRGRGRLSPEQEVSLAVFEIAAKDTALKLSSLFDEQRQVRDAISATIGQEVTINWNTLSAVDFRPNLPERFQIKNEIESQQITKSNLEAQQSEMNLELEKGNSWPDLKIGPVFKINTDGSDRFYSGGVGLSLPLPLFNVNGGARAAARAEAEKTKLLAERQKQEVALYKNRLIEKYERLRVHTTKMNDIDALDKKHRRLESLFSQGVVSSALVIESHRQLLEFLQEYHTAERTQLESLWKLYSLENRLSEEIVK